MEWDRAVRVLYIEDTAVNVALVSAILRRRPAVQLRVAGTGEEGVAAALADGPALVLLDLHLPDIDGHEVLRRLRADPATEGTPVVVVSADAATDARERVLAAGPIASWPSPWGWPTCSPWSTNWRLSRRWRGPRSPGLPFGSAARRSRWPAWAWVVGARRHMPAPSRLRATPRAVVRARLRRAPADPFPQARAGRRYVPGRGTAIVVGARGAATGAPGDPSARVGHRSCTSGPRRRGRDSPCHGTAKP
jgi:CheY-like chemotaxis protein